MLVRVQGNAAFKRGDMGAAIEHYTFATEMDPTNHIFFTNRAAAYAHMKKWDKSLRDSNKSIKLKSDWHKVGSTQDRTLVLVVC